MRKAFALLILVGGCRGCGDESPASQPDSASSPDAAAAISNAPRYLPTRNAPDDSPEALSLVEQTLFTLRPQLNLCYRDATRESPGLEAQVIMGVTIDTEGKVTDVTPISTANAPDSLLACLKRQIKTAHFARPPIDAGTVTVKVPISFKPRPDAGR